MESELGVLGQSEADAEWDRRDERRELRRKLAAELTDVLISELQAQVDTCVNMEGGRKPNGARYLTGTISSTASFRNLIDRIESAAREADA